MQPTTSARRVILYARVSLERDARSKSVDDQLTELRAWATREGWEVVSEHRDDGVSASRFAAGRVRPGWQEVMVELAGVGALLVWEISRASRDLPVFAALFAACEAAGVLLGTGGRLHDLTDPEDAFALGLGALVAVRESAATSKRVRRAVESRAAAGRPAGTVPYGYRRVIDSATGTTTGRERHPIQAPVVAEIVRRLLAREPAHAVAADLNNRGVPTGTGERWLGRHLRAVVGAYPDAPVSVEIRERLAGGELPKSVAADLNARAEPKPLPSRWTGGNLSRLALRPTYAGLRVHHGQVLEGVATTWPPIITEAEHYQLVGLYGSPERDRFRNPTHVRHLGAGLYRCGREGCTGRMRVVVHVGRPNRYDCRVCHRVSRHQEPVDELVTGWLVRYLSRPDVLAELGADEPDLAGARLEVARLEAKLAELERLADADEISVTAFARLERATREKLEAARESARPRHLPDALADLAGSDAATRWAATSVEGRRAVLDALVVVTILPAFRGAKGFDPSRVQIARRGTVT